MRSVRIWRGIHKGVVVATVVGLSPVHCHSKKDIIFLETGGSALQEAQIDACRVFKISQYLDQTVAILAVFVAFQIEKNNFGQLCDCPTLDHLHLTIVICLYLILHDFLHKQQIQGLTQLVQRVTVMVFQKQVQLIELFIN